MVYKRMVRPTPNLESGIILSFSFIPDTENNYGEFKDLDIVFRKYLEEFIKLNPYHDSLIANTSKKDIDALCKNYKFVIYTDDEKPYIRFLIDNQVGYHIFDYVIAFFISTLISPKDSIFKIHFIGTALDNNQELVIWSFLIEKNKITLRKHSAHHVDILENPINMKYKNDDCVTCEKFNLATDSCIKHITDAGVLCLHEEKRE